MRGDEAKGVFSGDGRRRGKLVDVVFTLHAWFLCFEKLCM